MARSGDDQWANETRAIVYQMCELAYRQGWNDAEANAFPDVGSPFGVPSDASEGWNQFLGKVAEVLQNMGPR